MLYKCICKYEGPDCARDVDRTTCLAKMSTSSIVQSALRLGISYSYTPSSLRPRVIKRFMGGDPGGTSTKDKDELEELSMNFVGTKYQLLSSRNTEIGYSPGRENEKSGGMNPPHSSYLEVVSYLELELLGRSRAYVFRLDVFSGSGLSLDILGTRHQRSVRVPRGSKKRKKTRARAPAFTSLN